MTRLTSPKMRIGDAMAAAGIAQRINMGQEHTSENSLVVLQRRYLRKNAKGEAIEQPTNMYERVADNLSQAELLYNASEEDRREIKEQFYRVMTRHDFLPNSPTLMNAGRELQQLSACFVLPVNDSIESIFTSAKDTAVIHKSGGGTGFSFSRIRPAGDPVGTTGGIASGPVSFIKVFDTATDVVKQGGTRRGANMGILEVTHPDIREFIESKRSGEHLQNFNISVAVTEEFMETVIKGEEYSLVNPSTREVTGQLNAREIFDLIVDNAWATGDPGLIFLDRINRDNPNPHLGRIESTNPCVTADTVVMTAEGPQTVANLVGRPFTAMVQGKPYASGQEGFFPTGRKKVIRLQAEHNGLTSQITLTPGHLVKKVEAGRSEWTEAGSIQPGDRVELHNHGEALEATRESREYVVEQALEKAKLSSPHRGNRLEDLLKGNLTAVAEQNANPVTPADARVGIGELSDVLRREGGQRGSRIQGVLDRVNHQKTQPWFATLDKWKDATYEEAVATLPTATRGLADPAVQTSQVGHITSIEEIGEREVYDVRIEEAHAFDGNGFVLHNCGEQPLAAYESCNLGSINLARMVRYTDQGAEIDEEKLEETVRIAVRMLDNVIDMNNYPMKEIEDMTRSTRRIGVGIMGFADLLVQLGIKYDSEEGLHIAEHIMSAIQRCTHNASHELAKERGCFPEWGHSIYNSNGHSREMRNSAPVTIAPTGTISIIAGASSGIEPLFALSYVRNVMDNTHLFEGYPYFEAVAKHEGFYSIQLMEQLAAKGSLHDLDVPEWTKEVFRTSHDISPEWHVRMQAAFQKYTDNSVSKTINFPNEATREDVLEAYMRAYETGCKGITVYRDGSKENQVLSTGAAGAEPQAGGQDQVLYARERPKVMNGRTERLNTGHGSMYITINTDEKNLPFEVFANLGKAGGCDSAQLEAICRLASVALRAGVCHTEIISNLLGITCCPAWDNGVQINSAPDALARALINAVTVTDDREPEAIQFSLENLRNSPEHSSINKCPDCNAKVVYKEGCLACTDAYCGWNKC